MLIGVILVATILGLSHPTTMGTVIATPTARIIGKETYPAMRNL